MKQINLLLFSLVLLPGFSLAVILPDGYYNIIESNLESSRLHDEMQGLKIITFFSPATFAFQYKFDSTNKTVEFNNGGTNDWEYEHYMETELWIDSVTLNISFFLQTSIEFTTPTATDYWVLDASYTPISNLYLINGTQTETEDGTIDKTENLSNTPILLTADADMALFAEMDSNETDVELNFELGLKQGSVNLSLTDINGQYHLSARGFFDDCRNFNTPCTEVVQEGWADILTFSFNGSGGCTIDLNIVNDFAVQRKTSDVTNAPLYVNFYDDISSFVSCSYVVTGVDTLQISLTSNYGNGPETDTINFKVSKGHRYLVGDDPYTTSPSEDFVRGTMFAMRKDTSLETADFTGTYLGHYQGVIYDNTDDSATDVTTIKYFNRAFALTFDGQGGCTYKEYKNIATAHYYPPTDTGEIVPFNSEYEAECAGGYSIVTDGAHQYVKVVIISGEFVMNGYLSDNGETISFFKPVAENLTANDGLNGNLPQGDYTYTATVLKLLSGVAIKYAGDSQSTATAISAWLNTPGANFPAIYYLLL